MSAPVSGKFQDHYTILGLQPGADTETIRAAYASLAEKFSPNNPRTGDDAKFESIGLAYEVLSDPLLRAEFDKLKGIDREAGHPTFTGIDFFRALQQGAELRAAVLCILYDRRRLKSSKPSLSMRNLENMLQATLEELNFALWYLKQRGLVTNDDKSNMQITVEGMDHLELHRPSPEAVMPMIKKEALAASGAQPAAQPSAPPAPAPPTEPPVSETTAAEPVLSVLNWSLERSRRAKKA